MTDPLVAPQEAVEAGARAMRDGYLSWDAFSVEDAVRAIFEAALPAFLAAGWLPPNSLELVCWYSETAATEDENTMRPKGVPLYRLAAGWTPPEGEKT